jgi:predicted ATP-dependent endonuclease of OLD family
MELKGKKARMVSNAITNVIKEFTKRSHVKKLERLEIYITKDPVSVAKKIIEGKIEVRRHGEVREWLVENASSFSYWTRKSTPVIMLNANEDIFKEMNYNAIEGLFAHELMHLINKMDGIEKELDEEIDKMGENIVTILDKHKDVPPFTKERLFVSLVRVTTASVLFIKDIFANSRAMSFGFDEELYENYKATLRGVKNFKFLEEEIIQALKDDQKHVLDNAFITYIGLNFTWVNFKMFEIKWYKYLKEMARIEVPPIIKKNGNRVLREMLKLRSEKDEKQIEEIIKVMQDSYYKVVKHFCGKLK